MKPNGEPPRKKGLPQGNWFRELFGFDEVDYETTRKWLYVAGERLHSHANEKNYQIGHFSTPSLAELREEVLGNDTVCSFLLEKSEGTLTFSLDQGDVSMFLASPENMFATFQVASQFNCLEFASPSMIPEDGIYLYIRDRTQGPACSIACGPATAYRNYFAPVEKGNNEIQIGQTKDCMIDNLRDFSMAVGNDAKHPYFSVLNGYSMAKSEGLKKLNKKVNDPLDEALMGTLRVGVHNDIQVTSANWGSHNVADKNIIVTQIFSSACAINYNRGSSMNEWEVFARLVLYATYESTFLAAIQNAYIHKGSNASKRLYLSAIGGGVFGNRMSWIADAIYRCCKKFKNYDLDVRFISYGFHAAEMIELSERLAEILI